MDDTNKIAFRQFLDVLREITGNDTEVINLIERRYAKANPSYTSSSQFLQLLRKVQKKVKQDAENKYIFLKELTDELKAYDLKHLKKRKRKNLILDSDSESSDVGSVGPVECNVGLATLGSQKAMDSKKDKDTDVNERSAPQQKRIKLSTLDCVQNSTGTQGTKLGPCSPKEKIVFVDFQNSAEAEILGINDVIEVTSSSDKDGEQESAKEGGNTDVEEILDNDDSGLGAMAKNCNPSSKTESLVAPMEGPTVSPKNAKKIRKYQLFLERLDDRIKKLEEKEVSLDDLEDGSNYLIIDKLKKTFVKHWSRLCELQARNPTTGRPIDKKFKCTATRYPEINKRIQKFINKKKIFPDYHDVRSIVQKCNVRYKLGLGKGLVDMVSRDAFTDVGNKLQRRRMEDYDCAFGSHLTDTVRDYDDPALYDVELRRKLENNQKQSKSNLDELIKKFAYKQETEGDNSEDDEKDTQEDDEIQREEQEILRKDDDAVNVSDEDHDDTVTCGKQTNDAAENRKTPIATNVNTVDEVDRVQESDCKTSNNSQEVFGLPDGIAVKEVNAKSKDKESSSTEDSKKKSKREEVHGTKTVSLQDILGGSTITKEDVETFHKENFPESNEHNDPKVGVESCHLNRQVMQHRMANDNDDFIEVLSSASDEVPEENFGRRKPVYSPEAREGIKRLKQLKQPSLLQQVTRERGGVSSNGDNNNVHSSEISTIHDTENKSFVLLSGKDEERFHDDCADLGCSLLDPQQQVLGTPFRRTQLLAGDSSFRNPESSEVSVTRATRSPGQVASTVSTVSESHEMESEVPWVVSDVRSLSSKQLPDNDRDRSGKPPNENIASQCRIERNKEKMRQWKDPAFEPRPDTARRVLTQHGNVASTSLSRKYVTEAQQSKRAERITIPFATFDRSRNVVVLDDDVDDTESVLDMSMSSPLAKFVDRPSVISRKELYVIPSDAAKSSSDYTYKKVHTVVKQTSVSSSSSKNPQKETVVRSSSKTIIRRTPQEYERDEVPAFHSQASPRVMPQTSGNKDLGRKSALSGFRLTRRKINNKPPNMNRQSPSSTIKEVQNVTGVLGGHKGNHSQPSSEDEPIVLDDSDILEYTSAVQSTGASDRSAKKLQSQVGIVGNINSPVPCHKDHSMVNTRPVNWLGNERVQGMIGKCTPRNMVRSVKGDPNKRSFQVMPEQQQSVTFQIHQGHHHPQETTSTFNMYADSVISSSEQPPDLGEPDCVIILSDSD